MFCVGATKASTTWLYKFLLRHPECHLRSIKELHYFDRLDAGKTNAAAIVLQNDVELLRADMRMRASRGIATKIKDTEAWIPVLQNPSDTAYVTYLTAEAADRGLVADITPSYALLSEDRLRKMANLMPDVRFVYLIRDPVARLRPERSALN